MDHYLLDNLDINPEFSRAIEAMEAGKNLLVTGKAGTGKSTLLSYFRTRRSSLPPVIAPTGIAALNVEGMTIHRFFGWGPSITPDIIRSGRWGPPMDLSKLKTLIIDEISMVRADLFDCIELALRLFGPNSSKPFGGVQILLFGDLLQLDPVLTRGEHDWWFEHYGYRTKFFFSAHAMENFSFESVELRKIYRQSEKDFIELLECVRTDRLTQDGLDRINARYDESFEPGPFSPYVTVTPKNEQAERINKKQLGAITEPEFLFRAKIEGDVQPEDWGIIEKELRLKVGAKVMMINNQSFGDWVNGSIGVVKHIDEEEEIVSVLLLDSQREVEVERHLFEIGKHQRKNSQLEWQTDAIINQFPMRLSWAITVHKSQGQTLSHVLIDPYRGFFADGHLYVALSRCTTFDGVKLNKRIRHSDLKVSREVLRFLAKREQTFAGIENRPLAFLGIIETGFTEHSKLVEFAAIVVADDGTCETFSTLLAPMTDVGNGSQHGIVAEDLCLAPTISEAWGYISRRLHDCIWVSVDNAAEFRVLNAHLKSEGVFQDMPVGVSLTSDANLPLESLMNSGEFGLPENYTALELAISTKLAFEKLNPTLDHAEPFNGKPNSEGYSRLFSRDNLPLPDCLSSSGPFRKSVENLTNNHHYADYTAMALADLGNCPKAGNLIWNCHQALDVASDEVERIHDYLGTSLRSAIERDARLDDHEERYAKAFYSALDLRLPTFKDTDSSDFVLRRGMTICFSGDGAVLEKNQRFIKKQEFEEAAAAWGLRVEQSLTKSRTDLLVLMDRTSMSSKAKNALKWGKSIWSIHEFSDAIDF